HEASQLRRCQRHPRSAPQSPQGGCDRRRRDPGPRVPGPEDGRPHGQRTHQCPEPDRSRGRRREGLRARQGGRPRSQGRHRAGPLGGQEPREGGLSPMADNRTVDVLDPAGTKSGTVELPAPIFDAATNVPLIHQVVNAQQAAARRGTHKTKTRSEVRGGGKKPWKQKGTGRARQGSLRAPQFAGGATVHGPVPRDYSQRTPKKMKAAALRGALSDRARNGRVHVVSSLLEGDVASTKAVRQTLSNVSDRRHLLVVVRRDDDLGALSSRNLPT